MIIVLTHCTVEKQPDGTKTVFRDGQYCFIGNNADEIRQRAANDCGLGHDMAQYNFEHEFTHAFLAEYMFDKPSPVLWNSAHGIKGNITAGMYEERWVYHFQRAMRDIGSVREPEWYQWIPVARGMLGW